MQPQKSALYPGRHLGLRPALIDLLVVPQDNSQASLCSCLSPTGLGCNTIVITWFGSPCWLALEALAIELDTKYKPWKATGGALSLETITSPEAEGRLQDRHGGLG